MAEKIEKKKKSWSYKELVVATGGGELEPIVDSM